MDSKYSRYYIYIKPIVRNKTVRTYSSLVFSLITITIFVIYALKPTISTIIALQKSIKEQQDVLFKLQTKSQNLSLAKENYQNLDDKVLSDLLTLLPSSTTLPPLVEELNNLSKNSKATVSGIQVQPIDLDNPSENLSKKVSVKEILFTVNIQGTYEDLSDILKSLAKTNRLLNIQGISLNKPADGPILMSINAKAYYFKN